MKKNGYLLLFISFFSFSQTNKNYVAIGFSSICCGTLSEKPVVDFIRSFEKQNKLKTFEIFNETGLGKEGENCFYIGTDQLNARQLKSFWSGLKSTANSQNKNRKENHDGYVNVDDKFTPNSTLKGIKNNPRTRISSLQVYNYKK